MPFLGIPTSRKDLGKAGWIKGAATVGARAAGNVSGLLGNNDQAQRYRTFADAVDDPNKGYAGTLNPLKIAGNLSEATGQRGGSGSFGFTTAPAVLGASATNPNGGGGGGGGDGTGSYANGAYGNGSAAYDPDTDPTKIAAQRNSIRNLLSIFASAYDDVVSKVDALAADKRAKLQANYDEQQQGLDKNFATTGQGIDDQYSARNAYHSSYRENAQQQARDAYDTATKQLGESENTDLADIGQFAQSQKAELAGSRPTFNPDDYTTVSDLLSIGQDVQSAINKINTTGAGLGTNSQYIKQLNGIAPKQETGSATLKAQLDKLSNLGTTPEAKRAIAATTIANAGGDQSVWMDYFEKQLQQTGSDVNAGTDTAPIQMAA